MHAADSTGGKYLDAGHCGDDHGCGHGGGSVLAAGDEHGQIAARSLGHGLAFAAQVLDFVGRAACFEFAADDGDGGGHGTAVTDGLFDFEGGFHILRIGHAVGDDGGLESDHGTALVKCLLHFG